MYSQKNLYSILGINSNATKEQIKKAYRDIAIKCHPDKLHNILDENEIKERTDKFKEATFAYEKLINENDDILNKYNDVDWSNIWGTFFTDNMDTQDLFQDIMFDMANSFVQNNIYPKTYYNPSSKDPINVHNIELKITYKEIIANTKKKLRLILIDIPDPIFVEVYCGSYPRVIKEYSDDEDNDHEIIINMKIKEFPKYEHFESKSGHIDLFTKYEYDLLHYIQGCEVKIPYVDGTMLNIKIPPFQKDRIIISGKGIKEGSLIIDLIVQNFDRNLWDCLSEKDKVDMLRILNILYKTI